MEISSGKHLCPKVQAHKMTLKRPDGKRGDLIPQEKRGLGRSFVLGYGEERREVAFYFYSYYFYLVFISSPESQVGPAAI